MVDAEERERMEQRPSEAGDAAEVACGELAPEEDAEERAVARARVRGPALRGDRRYFSPLPCRGVRGWGGVGFTGIAAMRSTVAFTCGSSIDVAGSLRTALTAASRFSST